jgi:spore coat polysaccharide biosynthesis protein SpsF
MIERLRRAEGLDDIVIATSVDPRDEPIADLALRCGVPVFRGSEDDVLQRVSDAHAATRSTVIVETTGDCPLIDPQLVDLAIDTFFANSCDVVSSAHSGTYPSGTDVQVFRASALAEIAATVADPAVREHVSLHFYRNPARYRIIHLVAPRASRRGNLRLDLDYPEDLTLIRAIHAELASLHGSDYGVPEVLALLDCRPDIAGLNAMHKPPVPA